MQGRRMPLWVAVIGWAALWLATPWCAFADDDTAAHARLEEMANAGVLRDALWANAYWARARAATDDTARAGDLQWALRFDPELNGARWDLVALRARQRDGEALTLLVDALRVGFGTFPGQQRALVWALTLVFGALAATLTALTLLAAARTVPRIHHAIHERLSFLPGEIRSGAALLTLLVPLILPFTLAPTAALFWLLLFGTVGGWTLMSVGERRIGIAALLVMLASPVVLSGWTRILEPGLPTNYLHALWASQRSADTRDAARLDRAPATLSENDPAHWASLALVERRRGQFRRAEEALRRATTLAPDEWSYWNNLGNVQLLNGDPDRALASYRKAHELAPGEPLVFVNQAQARVQKLEFAKADAAMDEAGRLGYRLPPLAQGEGLPRDRVLESAALWARFAKGRGTSSGLSPARTLEMTMSLLLPVRPHWMSIPLLLAIWYVSLVRTLPRSFACSSCGKSICRKCHYRVMRRSLCAHCHAIRRDVHAPLRRQQLLHDRQRRVSRWGRALSILLSVLVPGSGLAVRGLPRRGAV
ncbi:tetratricopeptide repeat protein, partial [bacterium]|nr:tetratricopeptide repeat protein [bacterium]